MTQLSVSNLRIIEGDSSSQQAVFTVSLASARGVPTRFFYYTQDGSASVRQGDFFDRETSATIPAGQLSIDISVTIDGDTLVEGDETFQLIIFGDSNVELLNNAAALVATATIVDNNDAVPDAPGGVGGPARQLFGPPSASTTLPTLGIRNLALIEGNSSSHEARFLVTLDRPATADVTFDFYTQDISATSANNSDYFDRTGTVTIPAGRQTTYIEVTVDGDTDFEPDEAFSIVLTNIRNAVFAGNASSLVAGATILSDDDGGVPDVGGVLGFGGTVAAPVAEPGVLPTLSVRDVSVIEGNSGSEEARFLVQLDRPATSNVTFTYHLQDRTASGANNRDYFDEDRTVTILAGQQSAFISVTVVGDTLIEVDEQFDLVVTNVRNAVLEDAAASIVATATVIDNDGGTLSQNGSVGGFADPVIAVSPVASVLPTLSVRDVTVIEGNSSSEPARFLVSLDRPAPAEVRFLFTIEDGSASGANNADFFARTGVGVIAAGQQSTFIEFSVVGDINLEADETVNLVVSGVTNAVLEGNAPALVAQATILDNDSGPLSGSAGIGARARPVANPVSTGPLTLDIVDVSIAEGNSSSEEVNIHVLLSDVPTADVRVDFQTVGGSATSGVDFFSRSGTLVIPAGQRSSFVQVSVIGDGAIEGDETLSLQFTNISGAVFANGQSNDSASILIRGNDGLGTAGSPDTGPAFLFAPFGSPGNDFLTGVGTRDVIEALGGNDTVFSGGGDDEIYTGSGNDEADGGSGNDTIEGDLGNDFLFGSFDDDMVFGGTGNDTVVGNGQNDFLDGGEGDDFVSGENGFDTVFGGDGNDQLNGGANADVLNGGAGSDTLFGQDGFDILNGDAGIDTLRGGQAADVLNGGDGNDALGGDLDNDTVDGGSGNDLVVGSFGDDSLIGGTGSDTVVGGGQNDTLDGSSGNDFVSGENGFDTVFGGAGNDTINGGDNADLLNGGTENDLISGGNGLDALFGDSGNDTLIGNAGNDNLQGGSGFDVLDGGIGNDMLTGGANWDVFVFGNGFGIDRITDFDQANSFEVIDLSGLGAIISFADLTANHLSEINGNAVISAGVNSLTLLGVSAASLEAGDFIF